MNVMFIVSSLYGGGAERVVSRIASALCAEHDVHIVVLSPLLDKGDVYEHDPRIHIHEAIPYLQTPSTQARYSRAKIYRILRSAKHRLTAIGLSHGFCVVGRTVEKAQHKMTISSREARWEILRQLKKEHRIDVAISFMTGGNLDNVESRCGEVVIVSVRNILNTPYPGDGRFTPAHHEQIRRASELADAIVTVSRNVGREQIEMYGADPSKIVTIYNPVNIADLRNRARDPIDDQAFVKLRANHAHIVLTMGRHVYQKGQWHLIRAMKRVRAIHPDTALVILGKGPLADRLESVIEANGLEDHVLLAGFQNPFPYMGQCDVFCLSSLFEGFSNALLEAMACGMPLVSTDCNSGPRELMAPKTDPSIPTNGIEETPYGYLVAPLSGNLDLVDEPLEPAETALADAIASMLSADDFRERCAENIAIRIEDFSTDRIISQWEELLRSRAKATEQDGPPAPDST